LEKYSSNKHQHYYCIRISLHPYHLYYSEFQQKRSTYKPSTSKNSSALRSHPDQFVYTALKKIESEEWKDKVEGINMIVQIAETSPQALTNDLHAIIVALLSECKNLRSSVSRVAIASLGHLFSALNTKMDNEIEKVCLVLLQKAGDVSNAFIRKDATGSLDDMVKNATASKVLTALIASGLKSKNNAIRTECAASVNRLLDRVGPKVALRSKDSGKLIEVLYTFAKDPHPSVRYYGKFGLQMLNQVYSLLPLSNGAETLEFLNCTVLTILMVVVFRCLTLFVKFRWEQRLEGLKRFEEMVMRNARIVASDTKVLDAFVGRLNDINAKVALEAMETYLAILYSASKYLFFSTEPNMKALLSQIITALMSHLPSRSEEHRRLAKECISESIKRIDNSALAAAVAAATKQSNVKQRPFMLRSMSINASLYRTKPHLIEVVSLPILWGNVRSPTQMNCDPEVKRAMKEYAQVLSKCIGKNALLEQANAFLSPVQKRYLEMLI
uniref:TOG domain-containing protein n=1 Tax=Syphacia muris TaxID=451379 RepID=A0A0N5AGC8_9BILA